MADGMNALHDLEESRVYFFARPGNAHAILRHFQPGGGNAARVCRFARAIQNSRLEKPMYPRHRRRHIRAFRNDIDTILEQVVRILCINFVLGSARKGTLGIDIPKWIVIELHVRRREHSAFELLGVFRNATAPDIFQVHDEGELFPRNSLPVVNEPARIRKRDGLGT